MISASSQWCQMEHNTYLQIHIWLVDLGRMVAQVPASDEQTFLLVDLSRMVAQVPASDEQTFYEWIVIFDAQLVTLAHCI